MENIDSNIIVFTHRDLDGVSSYLTLNWILGKTTKIITTTPHSLYDNINIWLKNDSFDNYKKIFFLDLDTSIVGDIIDQENVIVIDHHTSHSYVYKNAKTVLKEYSSCVKLLKDTIGKTTNFNDDQKLLIALADDHDAHTKKSPFSDDLNIVFHNTNNKVESFIINFRYGFKRFDRMQKNIIAEYKKKRDAYLQQDRTIYVGKLPIKGNTYKVISVIASEYISEISDNILEKYDADIVFIVMLGSQKVCIRKKESVDVDLSKLAEKMLDGGGHFAASGGHLTELFKNFSKTLKPL